MNTADNIAGNINTDEINITTSMFSIIIAVILILVIITAILVALYIIELKKHKKLKEFMKTTLNEEEQEIITEYRKLDVKGKSFICDTLKTLNNNNQSKDDGN